jgi:hypothetical protein
MRKMLAKLRFKTKLESKWMEKYLRHLNSDNRFRVAVENENHDAMSNEHFKYKTPASENFLSSNRNAERLTSFVETIQVLSTPEQFEKIQRDTMSEVSRDRLGQWPLESESELPGQGLQRLKNGRFNKVSPESRVRRGREKKVFLSIAIV